MNHAVTAAPGPASQHLGGRSWWAGIVLAGAVAGAGIAATQLPAAQHLGLSALTLAIIFGIIAGNTFFPAIAPATGTRVFKLDRQTSVLIGTGSAICGAAAVLAAEPVVRAQPHSVSVAVATVVVFGTLGMFVYPLLYPHLGLSQQTYGIFAGSTIHEVAQVVAAGRAVSDTAASTAVIEKMLRVMMLAPFLFLLSHAHRSGDERHHASDAAPVRDRRRVTVPWFAVLFVVACGVNSAGVLPAGVVKDLIDVDTLLLAMAMAALGLRTHAGAIRQAGVRPLMLAGALFAFLTLGGYAVNRLVMSLLG